MHPAYRRQNLWVLAATYFFYFGLLGVLVPYLGVFLDGRGFNSAQIGQLFALVTMARIVGPYLWASKADKSSSLVGIIRFGLLFSLLSFLLVFWVDGFWGITLSMALMMCFWTAILPQLEVITLTTAQSQGYARIRLWGSVGYMLLTVVAGALIDLTSSELPIYASVATLAMLLLCSLAIQQPPRLNSTTTNHIDKPWALLLARPCVLFLSSAFLLQLSFGPYYGFFALYMRDLGYSSEQTGWLIALSVLAEVGIFLIAGQLIKRFGVKWLLVASMLFTALRWWLLAEAATVLPLLIGGQLLHAFSFGLTHAVSMHFIYQYFPKAFQSRGQAIYASLSFGCGGALGNVIAGSLWQQGQGAYQSFMFAAFSALLGGLLLLGLHGTVIKKVINPPN